MTYVTETAGLGAFATMIMIFQGWSESPVIAVLGIALALVNLYGALTTRLEIAPRSAS